MVHIYNGILLIHKKRWNFSICNNMGGLEGYYDKWNKSEKEKYYIISLMESKKYNKLVNKLKMKQTHRYREPTCDYPEKWGGVP